MFIPEQFSHCSLIKYEPNFGWYGETNDWRARIILQSASGRSDARSAEITYTKQMQNIFSEHVSTSLYWIAVHPLADGEEFRWRWYWKYWRVGILSKCFCERKPWLQGEKDRFFLQYELWAITVDTRDRPGDFSHRPFDGSAKRKSVW